MWGDTEAPQDVLGGLRREEKLHDYPLPKERCAHDRTNSVEPRESLGRQEQRRIQIKHAEVEQKAAPQPLEGTTRIYSRSYDSILSAQTPKPMKELRGQEGHGHHPGIGHHHHPYRDPQPHHEANAQSGQAGKWEAMRQKREREREQETQKQPS